MEIIDEEDDLFGRANAVDAFAVLLVVVILVIRSATLLHGSTPAASQSSRKPIMTQVVEFQSPGHAADIATLVTEGVGSD